MVMGIKRSRYKKYILIMILIMFMFASAFSVVYIKSKSLSTNLHRGFVLKSGEIPPQFIPEKYESRVLSWLTEQKIRHDYNISVLYDVPETATDDFYAERLYSYANTMTIFFAYEEGLQLEAGDKLLFEFVMADHDASRVCVGYAKDKKIIAPEECQYMAEGDHYIYDGEIEIPESGEYYPYIVNLSNETSAVRDFSISVVSD